MVYVSGDEHRVREVPRFFKIIPFVIFNREVTDGLRLSRKVARLCDAYGRILDRQDGEQRGDGCRRWIKFQPRLDPIDRLGRACTKKRGSPSR